MHPRTAILVAAAALALAACQSTPNEVQLADEGMRDGVAARDGVTASVGGVTIGKSVNQDHTIKDPTRTFGAKDTVYASVKVTGQANSGLVRALWLDPDGQPLQNEFRLVTPSRNEVVEFKAAKPDGLKAGEYHLEIYLDDRRAGSQEFAVR